MRKLYTIAVATCLIAACTPSAKVSVQPTAGSANFNNYLAIGSSYTAGAADNSLYVSAQLNSYPQRLYEQFQLVPGSNGDRGLFIQPLLVGDDGYPGPKEILAMTYPTCDSSDSSLAPVSYPNFIVNPSDAPFVNPTINGVVNNIGVPGIRVVDFPVQGYTSTNTNPYAARFFQNTSTASTPFDELLFMVNNLHPNFFTLWLGMEDVLGYATNGGQGNGYGTALPLIVNYYNPKDISPTTAFEKNYDSILHASISTGAQGALISIPDVDSLPFFTTIQPNGLILARQTQADSLKSFWGAATWNKVFGLGANYFIIEDHSGNVRQAVQGERILLSAPQDSFVCAGWGSVVPIPAQYVLTTDELQYIRTATQTFNAYIQQEASLNNLAFVNINAFLAQLYAGYNYNGVTYSMQFISGGAYSLDGINMTPRGYALVANQIIQAINFKYHSSLEMVNVNNYSGVIFP
jgi:hypothetical protein